MNNFRTEVDSVLGAGVTNRLSETIHNLCKATLAKITILFNICILYQKYLYILKFMSPISPVFNTSIKYCKISEIVNEPIVNYYFFNLVASSGLYFHMTDLLRGKVSRVYDLLLYNTQQTDHRLHRTLYNLAIRLSSYH